MCRGTSSWSTAWFSLTLVQRDCHEAALKARITGELIYSFSSSYTGPTPHPPDAVLVTSSSPYFRLQCCSAHEARCRQLEKYFLRWVFAELRMGNVLSNVSSILGGKKGKLSSWLTKAATNAYFHDLLTRWLFFGLIDQSIKVSENTETCPEYIFKCLVLSTTSPQLSYEI